MMRQMLAIVVLFNVAVTAPLNGQRIADEQSRREAIQVYRIGQQNFLAERFDRAADAFANAIEKDQLLVLAHYSLGRSYMHLRRYPSAIKAFQACIEAARALHALADTNRFLVEKRREEEIREMRAAIQAFRGSDAELRAMLAEQHIHDLENQRTSISAPFRPPAEVLLSLGSAYMHNDNPEEAEAAWKAAIEVNARLGEAHNNLAVIYMQTGRFSDAEDEIKLAEKSGFRVNPQFKKDLRAWVRR